jgi:hypothetical protein
MRCEAEITGQRVRGRSAVYIPESPWRYLFRQTRVPMKPTRIGRVNGLTRIRRDITFLPTPIRGLID